MKNWQEAIPHEIIDAYPQLASIMHIEPIEKGLINKTYKVITNNASFILQEVSPIFDEGINDDSKAVSDHLIKSDLLAPSIQKNRFDKLFFRHGGSMIRVLNFIEGESFHKITSLPMAHECGKVVGQFHHSLKDFSYVYKSHRRHKGDYAFHVESLKNALTIHSKHDYFGKVALLAHDMIKSMKCYLSLSTTQRHAHGDPKISNILFRNNHAICLIDFDTLGYTGWSLEMGDALRSWCNPHLEDDLSSFADLSIAEAALKGYASFMKNCWTLAEKNELILHVEAVSLCLAIRYLADVLNENYFSFSKQFERAAAHNWLRAQAMFHLHKDFVEKHKIISELVRDIL